MAAEAEVPEEISVLSEVRVDENCQVDTRSCKDLPQVDGDCDSAASEAVSDHNGEAETGKNGNSMGEDDPDGSYVFISRSNSVNGDSIERTLLEGDPVSADGSLNHDKEVQVQKLSVDIGEAAPQESKVHHEANESRFLDNVEPFVLEIKPVIDGCPPVLANGAQEEHKGVDLESIQLVSASQGDEGTPILILSSGDHQLYNGVAKIGAVNQESIPESDDTCLASKLREAPPESGVCASDVGNSHVQENEEVNGVSLGSTECTPPLIDDVKIQYEDENKIGSETETEKIHSAPLIDGIKINVDLEDHKGVDHEPIQLDSASGEGHRSPILILNDVDLHIDNAVAKIGVTGQESTPELDVTCLVSKLGEVHESGVLGSDAGIIKEEKNNSESCHGQENEEIEEGVSLESTERTPPFIDDMKTQYAEESKIGSETETEKTHIAPLIDYLKVYGSQEEHIGADHEPIQSKTNGSYPILTSNVVDPQIHNSVTKIEETDNINVNGVLEEHSVVDCKPIQSEDDGSSPILISNAVDPKLHNDVNKIGVMDQECTPELDETFLTSNLVEAPESGVIVSDIDNIEDKTNFESTCHDQESEERNEVPLVSTECTPPGVDDNKIQYEEETNTGSYTETEKIHAAPLIDDSKVESDKEVITESDREIEMSKEYQSIEQEATGRKQQQVEDENKAKPPMLMTEALPSEIRTPQLSDEAGQCEHGEENLEESGKKDDSQILPKSGLEVDLSKEVAKVTTEEGIPAVEGTSSKSLNEDIKVVWSNDICNLGAEVPNPPTDASLEDKNVPLDDCLLVEPVFTSPDPALSSSNVENESGMLNGVKVPLSPEPDPLNREDLGSQSTDSLENGGEADRKLECEIENSATSNDAPVCEPKDVDTDEKKSNVEDEAVDNGANTANCMPEVSDIQNEEQIDRDVTLPTTTEDAESKSNAPEEQIDGFGLVKKPFNYLIKMPRYENDVLRKQIERAQQEVEEKTKSRDVTKSEIKDKKAKSQELQGIFESARSDERSARGLVKSKRQEIDAVQSIINKVKNAITVDDIDVRIRGMEHMIQHETVPLREEKQYIREIKQLKHLREQLCSSMGSQDEVQQALDQKDEAEERLKILKKELDRLKDTVSNTEEAARVAWKKLDEEKNKIRELYIRFTTEDDVRQDAFRHMQNLKKQLRDKNVWFRKYKDEEECAKGYAASGDKEVLHLFCVNQVSKIMKQWNKDDEFRKEYIKCNERSTVRRFGTRDGRALGPDEKPHTIPKTWDRRTVSVVKPMKEKLAVIEDSETDGKSAEKEVVVQIEQKLKSEIPANPPSSDKSPEAKVKNGGTEDVKEESGGTKDVKEEKPEKTNEEIELERKAEELRNEEEMVRMKELRKLEEKVKEKEALDRKKKNAEKATVRAEVRAQKEKEQKEKEREKKQRKKERKKVSGTDEEVSREVESSSQTAYVSSLNIALTKEAEISVIKESNSLPTTTNTKKMSSPPIKGASIQFGKQGKSKLVPPLALRNKGKRRMQQWLWAIGIMILVIALFLIGNIGFYSSLKERKTVL